MCTSILRLYLSLRRIFSWAFISAGVLSTTHMMRQIVPSLLAALICVAFAPASYASGVAESTEISKLISQNEDTYITPNDLAFFLTTHNYDATPKDGYVQVRSTVRSTRSCPTGQTPEWPTCQLSISTTHLLPGRLVSSSSQPSFLSSSGNLLTFTHALSQNHFILAIKLKGN